MKAVHVWTVALLLSVAAVSAVAAQVIHPPSTFSREFDAKLAKRFAGMFGTESIDSLVKVHLGQISLHQHAGICAGCKVVFGPTGSGGKPSYLRLKYTPHPEPPGGTPAGSMPVPLVNIPPAIVSAAGNASLIVMGVPAARRFLPTETNDNIISEYVVRITRVFKPGNRLRGQSFDLLPGNTIIVVQLGGKLTVDGVPVTSINTDFPPLQLHAPYVFGLQFDPTGIGTFNALGEWTYHIDNGMVSVMSKEAARSNPPEPFAKFADHVEAAVVYMRSKGY